MINSRKETYPKEMMFKERCCQVENKPIQALKLEINNYGLAALHKPISLVHPAKEIDGKILL